MSLDESGIRADLKGDAATSNQSVPEQARITATLENWKRKLLDVSKRNRALNFRPNKVTTITIMNEQPAEAFRQLYLRDRQMRFRPAPPKPEAHNGTASAPFADAITETADAPGA